MSKQLKGLFTQTMAYFYIFIFSLMLLRPPSLVLSIFYNRGDSEHFPKNFVGSNLFGDGKFVKKCFSIEDVALLTARSKFEMIMPNFTIMTTNLENDKSVQEMLEYLNGANQLMTKISGDNAQYITQAAYYDVIGGFLQFFYLPFVKFSFYAGMLTYKSTLSVYKLHKHCKENLNTNGNGWRHSKFKFLKMNFNIQPINIHNTDALDSRISVFRDPCENLLLVTDDDYNSDYSDTELIISLPRIEIEKNGYIISVWLPFKHKKNFILNSKSSAFILTRYYVDVLKCYQFRKAISKPFSKRFQQMLYEKVLPFINKEEFYPGFGAILRVWETLKLNGVVERSAYKYVDHNDTDQYWQIDDNKINVVRSVNETNLFLKIVDSFKKLDSNWNYERKAKYICLSLIAAIVGLLLICVWIFIRRERSMPNIDPIQESDERKCDWKRLLKNLTKTRRRKYYENDVDEFNYSTSLASVNASVTQSEYSNRTPQQVKNKKVKIVTSGRRKTKYYKTLNDDDEISNSSSATSSNSTKWKKRRIHRKIRDELKNLDYRKTMRNLNRSIESTIGIIPSELNESFTDNVKMKSKRNNSINRKKPSSDSETEIKSSSWETLHSSKVVQNAKE